MRVSKNDQCFQFPYSWTPDALAYVDNTESGSRELFGTRFPNYQNVEALGQAWYGRTVEHRE